MPGHKVTRLCDLTIEEFRHETDSAYLFIIDGKEVWIPKSIGEWDEESDEVTVPEWWAIKEGLV